MLVNWYILTFWFQCVNRIDDLQITINQGILKGGSLTSWGGRKILAFQSIPYAEPPVEKRRFKPPVPAEPWKGILDASRIHPSCPQMDVFMNNYSIYGNEDCLYLNVYTPKISNRQLLPVIIYIHGGSFKTGTADYRTNGPEILLDKDLVLVTINYRLGALGFLSFENEVLPGNNGLKDQALAIKWVKHNIIYFGGDPNKLTLAGNSAGAASVYFHMVSPSTRDLIFAGISSSGIAVSGWPLSIKGEARHIAQKLVAFVNCPHGFSKDTLNCLEKCSAYDIVAQEPKLIQFGIDPLVTFKPVVEMNAPGAFITDTPINTLKSRRVAQIPFMNGITADDGAFKAIVLYRNSKLVEKLDQEFEQWSPLFYMFEELDYNYNQLRDLRRFYFGDRHIDNSTKKEVSDSVTDAMLMYSQRRISVLHAQITKQPVYFYLFGYKGSTSVTTNPNDDHNYGVAHCDDLIYLMRSELLINYTPTKHDLKMNEIMTTLWYNFANTGNPTPEVNNLITSHWKPVECNKFHYYNITNSNKLRTMEDIYSERFQFWESLKIFKELSKGIGDQCA